MYNTYNMGLGMVLAVSETDADACIRAIEASGEKAYVVGNTVRSDKREVEIC